MNGKTLVSFAQRMFWLQEQIRPDVPSYNLPRVLLIKGALDAAALTEAFNTLLRRHDALRMSFEELDGEIVASISEDAAVVLPVCDLSAWPASERMIEARRLATEEGARPFVLSEAPLLRLLLLRLDTREHLLVLVMHHIVTDGWSMSLIFDEIAELYSSRTDGRPANLAPPPLHYADFVRWQREQMTDAALAPDVAWWLETLRGSPPLLELPADHARPKTISHRGGLHVMTIPPRLTEQLKQMCTREGCTLYMGLLGVFQILLARYTGGRDIVVGSPVAARNDEALTNLVGCFVNSVVLRTDLSGEPSFLETLHRVREVVLGALAHQHVPFQHLLAHLRPDRDPGHTPIFQVFFILQNMAKQELRLSGLKTEELALDFGMAKFDLTLEVVEQDQGLLCQFEYCADLFEPERIECIARHFVNLLVGALDAPATPISLLPLLSQDERTRQLVAWNRTEAAFPANMRIDDAFAAVVRRHPDDIALREARRTVTFAELDSRANQVAHALLARRLDRQALIGVHLDRAIDTYVAVLGILKAGHPYVPLDVGQPATRLRRLVADSGCACILVRRASRGALPEHAETILIDEGEAVWSAPRDAPARSATDGDLAYIVYTSGSTGDPKGVMGTHRATMNRFEWMYRTYPFEPGEVCCQKTALGFVDSIWEMFGPLLRGTPVVILNDDEVLDPERLLTVLAEHGVTRIVLVPTLLRVLLDHEPELGTRLPRLTRWTSSGEYLSADLARRFLKACPEALLLNLYGSSEVAGDVTVHEVRTVRGDDPVPIGKPIANTRVYILDDHMEPVPVGVAGQIYAGGACLSAGYWARPDLTAERFVPNPFDDSHSLLFATGDQGRFLTNGDVEYLGRLDGQVKIRGYRIEPGEIEARLAEHPGVRQAAVTVAGNALGESRQLVAYIVGQNRAAPSAETLRAFLRTQVPAHMVPAIFVELPALPLLPSGKIDRGRLPAPAAYGIDRDEQHVEPCSETESTLAAIWRDLLRLPEIGVTQNLFDLGGDSLIAIQLLVRIRNQFDVDLAIRVIFDTPTIRHLAHEIDVAKAKGLTARFSPIRARPKAEPALDVLAAELGKLTPEQLERLLRQVRQT